MLTPADRLWLTIIARTKKVTERGLRKGGFPERIIKAWRAGR